MDKPNTKELKCLARGALMNRHARLAGVTLLINVLNLLLIFLVAEAVPYRHSLLSVVLYYAGSLVGNMVYYILLAGLYRIYLNVSRGLEFRWSDLFSVFRDHPEPVALYSVLQFFLATVFTECCIWYMNLVIGNLYYQEQHNLLIGLLLLIVVAAIFIWLEISLSMVLFIFADSPRLSCQKLIRTSRLIMTGLRWRYFCLRLSFIGMYLLGILSLGIGFLFVEPYVGTAEAMFYEKLATES